MLKLKVMCIPELVIEGDDLQVLGKVNDAVADNPSNDWSITALLKGALFVLNAIYTRLTSTDTAVVATSGVVSTFTVPPSKSLSIYALEGNISVSIGGTTVAVIPEGGTFTFDRRRWLQYPEYAVSGTSFIVNYFTL